MVKRLPESSAWNTASIGQLTPCVPAAFIERFVDTEGGPQWIRALSLYHSGFMQDFTQNFLRKSEWGGGGGALGWPGWNDPQGPGLGVVPWGQLAVRVWSVPVAEIRLAANDGYVRTQAQAGNIRAAAVAHLCHQRQVCEADGSS